MNNTVCENTVLTAYVNKVVIACENLSANNKVKYFTLFTHCLYTTVSRVYTRSVVSRVYTRSYTIGTVLFLVDTPTVGVNIGTVGIICGITAKLRSCETITGLSVPDPAQ